MFTTPTVTKPETRDGDDISSRPRRDRDVPKNVSSGRARLETETFKTETTSLGLSSTTLTYSAPKATEFG